MTRIKDKRWPTYVDLCCGAGGLALGFRSRHWSPLLGVDTCIYSLMTFEHNLSCPTFFGDVSCEDHIKEIRRGMESSLPDAVIAGPPCQGFSRAGKRNPSDPRNNIIVSCAKAAIKLKPKVIVFENVRTASAPTYSAYITSTLRILRRAGYSASFRIVDAADFGLAQHRRRLVLFAALDCKSKLVESALKELIKFKNDRMVTVREAFAGLPRVISKAPESGFANHQPMCHSENVRKKIGRIMPGEGPLSYRKLDPDKPAGTLISGHRALPCHYSIPRTITVREAARIQGFPDSFVFLGPRSSQMQQVANAVPPKMAAAFATCIRPLLYSND